MAQARVERAVPPETLSQLIWGSVDHTPPTQYLLGWDVEFT
jgi:hypothetical protein